MKNKLAIFDLDGTLFDTKDVNYQSYNQALSACGYHNKIDYEYYCSFCNGNSYKVFLPQIIQNISAEDMEQIHQKKKELYPQYLSFARMNEHLFHIIKQIADEYQIALVTTASRKNVEDILNCFEVKELFDFIITQEDVIMQKPSPECFKLAMQKANASTEETIIFEDSDVGLQAAQASGANYVKVFGYN